MVNTKKLILSLSLPIFVTVVIPFLIVFFIEDFSLFSLITLNIIQLVIGIMLLGVGVFLVIWCIKIFYNLGKGTLMPLYNLETQNLVISGPYRFIRNPMILGVIVILFGESLVFGSYWIFGFDIFFFILNLIYIPLFEEKGLIKRFGDDFLKYKAKVHGWIPIKILKKEKTLNFNQL
ncbi:MAG: isoprenylcysteine carboxylmethyltransferase family protein [Candidatus Lokiarchaeota archaeon]|nr:isoprenylcysteine carboxylmethyltransferase family protein [Candidatus Lokiarchaeota archaeon]